MEPKHLRQGRLEAARRKDRDAVARVRAFRRWSRAGGDPHTIPAIPTDHEWKVALTKGVK